MIRLTPRAVSYLRLPHWPVERAADEYLGETPTRLIALGLMYREYLGRNVERVGVTDAGREAAGVRKMAVAP